MIGGLLVQQARSGQAKAPETFCKRSGDGSSRGCLSCVASCGLPGIPRERKQGVSNDLISRAVMKRRISGNPPDKIATGNGRIFSPGGGAWGCPGISDY